MNEQERDIINSASVTAFLSISQGNALKRALLELEADETLIELADCLIDINRIVFNKIRDAKIL
jgi:hypothetical protein